jgi:hypothetical protein
VLLSCVGRNFSSKKFHKQISSILKHKKVKVVDSESEEQLHYKNLVGFFSLNHKGRSEK